MPSRRQLLKAGAVAAAAALLPAAPAVAQELLSRSWPGDKARLPVIGLGGWRNFDFPPGTPGYQAAAETLSNFAMLGGRLIDSSPMYGRASASMGEIARHGDFADRLFYASKVWTRGARAGQQQLDNERAGFGRGAIDLMQVHNLSDAATQLAMLRAARDRGEVRLIGASHYQPTAHDELQQTMQRQALDAIQVNYSLLEPQAAERLLPAAADGGVAVLINRPFAEGALFAKVRGRPLPEFAGELAASSWAQLFLKWILAEPAVCLVITGTGNPRHIIDNLAAASLPLPDRDLRQRIARAVLEL